MVATEALRLSAQATYPTDELYLFAVPNPVHFVTAVLNLLVFGTIGCEIRL